MKKSLALMLAFSGLAALGGQAHAQLIAQPVLSFPLKCAPSLSESKTLSKSLTGGTIAGIPWKAGVSAGVSLFADCNRLTATGSVGVDATVFDALTVKPLEVALKAHTKTGGKNSLEWAVYAFGFEVKKQPIVESTTPISGAESVGWSIPIDEDGNGLFDGSVSVPLGWTSGSVMVTYKNVAQVAAAVIWKASPTEVSARAITAGNASASLTGKITYKGISYSRTAPFDIFRLTQGGRAVLKQVSGTQWKAEAANTVSLTDVASGELCWNLPIIGKKCAFQFGTDDYYDDYSVNKTFTKAF
jgi:hypothetical protein